MKHHTSRAMSEIAVIVRTIDDDKARFYKVNWIIVSTSHDICNSRGSRGHRTRQQIRRRLWRMTTKRHPIMRIYRIPSEIKGDMVCSIKITYKIIFIIKRLFRII
jgi:ribose 1,5-bisphosphokinase PhnN